MFMIAVDTTVVNLALPLIGRGLRAPVAGLQWTIAAYTITTASLMLSSGSIGDRFGRRTVLQAGLGLFTLASLGCSLAPSLGWLIAFRVLQGAGGSALTPMSMGIITATFADPAARTRAIGMWSGTWGIGMVTGPALGGVLAAAWGWRSLFWVNVVPGLIGIVLAGLFIPDSRAARPRRVDPPGQILVIVFLACLTGGIIEGATLGWRSPAIVAAFVGSAGALALLIGWERRRADPLIDLRVFRSLPFSGALAITVCSFACLGGFLFLTTIYLQDVHGLTALRAGIALTPLAAATAVAGPLAGRVMARRGARGPVTVGGAALGASCLALAQAPPAASWALLAAAYAVFGVGYGAVNTVIAAIAVAGMPRAQAGVAGGITSAGRQAGQSLGVSVVGAVLAAGLHGLLRNEFATASHPAWLVIAACGFIVLPLGLVSTARRAVRAAAVAVGTVPDHVGTVPDHVGTVPDHVGTVPDHVGTVPDHSGSPQVVFAGARVDDLAGPAQAPGRSNVAPASGRPGDDAAVTLPMPPPAGLQAGPAGLQAGQPGQPVPALAGPATPGSRRRGAARRPASPRTAMTAVPLLVFVVAAALALALLPGRGTTAGRPGRSASRAPGARTSASRFGTYPGEQGRGVFQTISRITAWDGTIVTTGAQVSDGVVRQQFFASADGGASWRLAPVRMPGGGRPPLGDTATRVAGGPNGWMAIGTVAPEAIWTSTDGLSWTLAARHGIAPQQPGDEIWVLTSTAEGFLAAGQAPGPGGRPQAVIWASHDGVTWQRMTASQARLAGAQSISYAASAGQDTVISGTLASGAAATWLSTDGGSTWTPVTVPAGHGAGTMISGLASDGSGLIAVRPDPAGGGIAYFSPNGLSWQFAATVGASGGFTPQVVRGSAYGFVVTGTDAAGTYVAYASAGAGTTWLPTGSLGPVAGYASAPAATVAPGGTVIASGSTRASKVSQRAVLLAASPGGAVRPVPLDGIPGAVVPEVAVRSLAAAGGQLVAVGSADGYPAIWRKAPGGGWRLVSSLSLVSARPRLAALTSVTHGTAGWLAVGVPGPVAFTSADGITWRPAPGPVAADLAGVVNVAAAGGPRGYVIVGKLIAPGGSCVAAVWWSPNLASWTRARDVNDTAGSSQVLAVAADVHGFISAGSHDGQPAVWTTSDGRTWTAIVLPLPAKGAGEAGGATGVLQHISIDRNLVVARGQQTAGGLTRPLTEISTDGGATWTPAHR
jgi:EmrB/QacA subfamily drug resistance transporter